MNENTSSTSTPSGPLSINHSKNRHKLLKSNTGYNNNENQKEVKDSHSYNSDDYSDKLNDSHTNDINDNDNTGKHYYNDINTNLQQQPNPALVLTTTTTLTALTQGEVLSPNHVQLLTGHPFCRKGSVYKIWCGKKLYVKMCGRSAYYL